MKGRFSSRVARFSVGATTLGAPPFSPSLGDGVGNTSPDQVKLATETPTGSSAIPQFGKSALS